MSSPILPLPESLSWKQAYMAAILEKDRARIIPRIENAREKISSRLREITIGGTGTFSKHEHAEEIDAIHEAFYLLEALRSSLAYRAEDAAATGNESEAA